MPSLGCQRYTMFLLAVLCQFLLPYAYLAIFIVICPPFFLIMLIENVRRAFNTIGFAHHPHPGWVWQEQQAVLTGALFWTLIYLP